MFNSDYENFNKRWEKKYIVFFKSAKRRLNSKSKRGKYNNTSQSSKKNEDLLSSQCKYIHIHHPS